MPVFSREESYVFCALKFQTDFRLPARIWQQEPYRVWEKVDPGGATNFKFSTSIIINNFSLNLIEIQFLGILLGAVELKVSERYGKGRAIIEKTIDFANYFAFHDYHFFIVIWLFSYTSAYSTPAH